MLIPKIILFLFNLSLFASGLSDCFDLFSFKEKGHISNYQIDLWRSRSKDLENGVAKILSESDIISRKPIGIGKSEGEFLTFKDDVIGVFKSVKEGSPNAWVVNPTSEVGAYKIDQLFGFNMVPLTVEREINGELGSVQLFVRDAVDAELISPELIDSFQRKKLELFDYIIHNTDRMHGHGNFLVTSNRRIIASDNGLSLRISMVDELPEDLLQFFRTNEGSMILENLRKISDDQIRNQLSGILDKRNIEGVIARKDEVIYSF